MGLSRVEQTRRVELDELHILHRTLGTIDHRNAVTGRNLGVGRCRIDSACSTGCHERDTAQVGVYLLRLGVEDIRTVALDIGGATGYPYAQMMLRDDLYGEMILQHFDIGVIAHRSHQTALDLKSRVVRMVQNSELRVSAFPMQVKRAILFLVEVNTPMHQFFDSLRGVLNHLFHCGRVTQPVTRYHRIVDMFLKIVH